MSPAPDDRPPHVRRRAMALRALSVAAALATAVAGVLWLCCGGALFLSVALALPATENWLPGAEVTRADVTIPLAGGTLAADLYRPARPRGAILLVHGLSPAGRPPPPPARPPPPPSRPRPLALPPPIP